VTLILVCRPAARREIVLPGFFVLFKNFNNFNPLSRPMKSLTPLPPFVRLRPFLPSCLRIPQKKNVNRARTHPRS
jgi:hypothetical protein